MPRTPALRKKIILGLAGNLVVSNLYDTVPNHWFEEEFEHLHLPQWLRPLLVLAKGSAVIGLVVGLRSSNLGRLTARALVAYFVLAVGAHVRVKDKPLRFVPAVGMLAWSALAARTFSAAPPSSI
jgi:hypothetical protein